MPITSSQRPGIYSDYDLSGINFSTGNTKCVGIVAQTSLTANSVNEITRVSDAETVFGANSEMIELCSLALKNGASKVICVSISELSPDYEAAFAVLESRSDIYVVICDSEDSTVHSLLKESVLNASSVMKERLGIVACSSSSDAQEWAEDFNCERMILIAQNPLDESNTAKSGCLITAAIAGLIVKNLNATNSFNGAELLGIPKLFATLSEEDIDSYILAGITPLEVILENAEIIRLVTSRTTTDGTLDNTFKEITTILTIDEVIPSLRTTLKQNLLGCKNNSVTRNSIATQTVIELEKFLSNNIIDSYEQPVISVSNDDPTVCIVSISFAIPYGLNQIHISADIRV